MSGIGNYSIPTTEMASHDRILIIKKNMSNFDFLKVGTLIFGGTQWHVIQQVLMSCTTYNKIEPVFIGDEIFLCQSIGDDIFLLYSLATSQR